jgi:hypothetical protein
MSGNFATILYGLAAGGKGWQQYMVDFPYQYTYYSENELYAFLYSKSFELISANPQQFLKTILGLYIILPLNFFNDLYDITLFSTFKVLSGFEYVIFSIVIILIIIGIFRFFLYSPFQPIKILFFLIILSTFISMPFYFLDGTIRTLVILTPYFGLGVVIGLRSSSDISKKNVGLHTSTSFTFTIPVIIGIIIIISLFLTPAIGPMIKHDLLNDNPENPQPVCTQNETFFVIRVGSGIPYLEIMNENSTSPPFAPLLDPDNRIINPLESFYLSQYYDLTDFIQGNDSPVLFWGYALNHRSGVFILSPKEIIGSRHRTIQFCGESINSTQPRGLWVYRLNQSSLE